MNKVKFFSGSQFALTQVYHLKVRPFIDMIERSFVRTYKCGRDLSFDEGSMAWKGRVLFKCYNPAKPAKWHLKLFEVSDAKTGYVMGFEVCTRKTITQCAANAEVLILIVIKQQG